jgi:type VI secretion system VasD/TssJ family lipoprotein
VIRIKLLFIVLFSAASFSGCATGASESQKVMSELLSKSLAQSIHDRESNKNIQITVAANHQLNINNAGQSRALAYCIYVIRSPEFNPNGFGADLSQCVSKDKSALIVEVERSVIAPNQIQIREFKISSKMDVWVMIIADYADKNIRNNMYQARFYGGGYMGGALWMTGTGLYSAKTPLPNDAMLNIQRK